MSTVAERAVAIGTALAENPDLPHLSVHVYDHSASIGAPGLGFAGVRDVVVWAEKFEASIIISLSKYGGTGTVETNVELGGVPVAVDTTIGSAQAYELGRILQRELNRDVSIHIGPEELLAAIEQVVSP